MDVHKALRELYQEKKRLDALIANLEEKVRAKARQPHSTTSRRGRRSMGEAERQQVSRRMSNYWAARKAVSPNGNGVSEPIRLVVIADRASA